MSVESLNALEDGATLSADIVIVGGGACGLTLAEALAGAGRRVIVLESGSREESPEHEALNRVLLADGSLSDAESAARDVYHRSLTRYWSGAQQQYGVRCRGLGGSTIAWAGKSAPITEDEMTPPATVPGAPWPIGIAALAPYLQQAAQRLNLGPGPYDAGLWAELGVDTPRDPLARGPFRTQFWKFARSRLNASTIMRVGEGIMDAPPPGVRVLTEATVTALRTNAAGDRFVGAAVQSLAGRTATIMAPFCVLAAGAIENPRLLLLSGNREGPGLGNGGDAVGRYLVDHPTTVIGRFDVSDAARVYAQFGLRGWRRDGAVHVCAQGVSFDPAWRAREGVPSGAVYVGQRPAADDPFAALRRLRRGKSTAVGKDALMVLQNSWRLALGGAMRAAERGYIPAAITAPVAGLALRILPNQVALAFQGGGVPRKLQDLWLEATTEQYPDPENRVRLAAETDPFDLPLPEIRWNPGPVARKTLLRLGQELWTVMSAHPAFPRPRMEPWVLAGDADAATVIDLGHPMGTTRMSDDPATGVVDRNCRVHGVQGLYVAGGSVLPGSGHGNPTLTILAVALRLADHLKERTASDAPR